MKDAASVKIIPFISSHRGLLKRKILCLLVHVDLSFEKVGLCSCSCSTCAWQCNTGREGLSFSDLSPCIQVPQVQCQDNGFKKQKKYLAVLLYLADVVKIMG